MRNKLVREDTLFLFIDIQDRLSAVMNREEEVHKNAGILADGAEIMGIDTIYTTQYEKGLGAFNQELLDKRGEKEVYDKKSFSCMIEEDFVDIIKSYKKKSIVIAGIEAHICVLLTARDLLNDGYDVYIAGDGVSSRKSANVDFALEELKSLGAVVRATESILFDLCSVSGTDEFRAISQLIR